ncbi:rhodanese-like domain-containing protein [Elioraea sp.]|uniref:MBL fold metallo-hydrolase n=1 Tax=Elioraea sp. TaxID=2185103 RepID=UPI0025BEC932|nr:MBL fold metallo-hydrolase [Elioraea sp.]
MALIFERIQTEGIAVLSYLIGDDSDGVAAVFDPTWDVDKYVDLARQKSVTITHIFETHIHADLVSGARELCARAGSAKIFLSEEGGASYGFVHETIRDGDRFEIGKTLVTVRHTPGHTPEHVSFLLADRSHPETPWGVLTGDSLFVNSAGRPDLLGEGESKKLAEQLFHTLQDFYKALPDGVLLYPAHGAGSPCGADIGDRLESSIGYERRHNAFLQFEHVPSFTEYALGTAPPVPHYYPLMKQVNARGPEILGSLPRVPGLPPKAFRQAAQDGAGVVVDTRSMLGFGGGHIEGALNIGGSPMLSIWAGWLLDPEEPILLVLDADTKLEEVVKLFLRTGYTRFAGYLVGGMKAWDNAGFQLEHVRQMTVHEVQDAGDALQVVDVRAPDEWKGGHVPGARHMFLPELREKASELDRLRPTAIYCDSGYRASIGTSILQQEGFTKVCNIPGSWQAWTKAGFPVEGREP